MLDFLGLLIRYIPFWAVPTAIIGLEFAYRYWIKQKRPIYRFFLGITFYSLVMIVIYFWLGGPEKTAHAFFELLRSF